MRGLDGYTKKDPSATNVHGSSRIAVMIVHDNAKRRTKTRLRYTIIHEHDSVAVVFPTLKSLD